jgi:hypothetical protein
MEQPAWPLISVLNGGRSPDPKKKQPRDDIGAVLIAVQVVCDFLGGPNAGVSI